MPVTKEYKSIQDRIATLETRKLKFKSIRKAEQVLTRYNYFDIINGFENILLKQTAPEKEYEDVFFEDFVDLYNLDMLLKKHTLFMILDIESRLRTSISYHFAGKYCNTLDTTLGYIKQENFRNPDPKSEHLTKVFEKFQFFRKTQYDKKTGKIIRKSFLDELKENYDYINKYEEPPLWVVIKAIKLGTLYYTYLFLDNDIQTRILADFKFKSSDNASYQQAIFILKEIRNQCAHLELITRFSLKRNPQLNYFNDITKLCNLSKLDINYMDVLKVLKMFGSIKEIKISIFLFYLKMLLKGRKKVAYKILGKMGRKSIWAWLTL